INDQLPGVYNPHIHSCFDGVVEKYRVHGFTNMIITTKGKGEVADTATYFCQWQLLLDDLRSFNEINGIIIMFFQAGGNCKYVRVKDDILRVIANLFG